MNHLNLICSRPGRHTRNLLSAAGSAAAALLLTALLPGTAATPCRAASLDITPVASPRFAISVSNFQNLGGADYKGPDGKPLTERLATAMRRYLADAAKAAYTVEGVDDPSGAAPAAAPEGAAHFTVEGELTQLEVGAPERRPYLLIARVYRDDKPRKLIAQFAGSAPSLRDLTGNLNSLSQGSAHNGLAGEVALEIADAAGHALPVAEEFDTMVHNALATRRITVNVVGASGEAQEARPTVASGEAYRLRVSSQDAGAVYIVAVDPATGSPKSVYAQSEAPDVFPGRAVILPPDVPFSAPTVTEPKTVDYVVFVRAHSTASSRDVHRHAATSRSVSRNRDVAMDAPAGSEIELLSSTSPLSGLDNGITSLLDQYKSDPAGTWTASHVTVSIVPIHSGGVPAP